VRVIYHDDLDGRAAAAIAVLAGGAWEGAELLPMDYSSDWHMAPPVPGEPVCVVDCMLEPESEMVALASTAALTWIDHHATSLRAEARSEVLRGAAGIRSDALAACELSWQHFHPGEPAPRAISLLGRYDRWDIADQEAWHGEIMPFQVAMESLDTDPRTDLARWREVIEGRGTEELVEAGRHIWRYQRAKNGLAAARLAREVSVGGLRGIAINAAGDSQLFESVWDPERHDVMIAYSQMADGRWSASLYSPKPEVDVSAIAEGHGGGGHRDAA